MFRSGLGTAMWVRYSLLHPSPRGYAPLREKPFGPRRGLHAVLSAAEGQRPVRSVSWNQEGIRKHGLLMERDHRAPGEALRGHFLPNLSLNLTASYTSRKQLAGITSLWPSHHLNRGVWSLGDRAAGHLPGTCRSHLSSASPVLQPLSSRQGSKQGDLVPFQGSQQGGPLCTVSLCLSL